MKDTFFKAKLIDWQKIRVALFSNAAKEDDTKFWLIKDFYETIPLKLEKTSSLSGVSYFVLSSPKILDLGHFYEIHILNFGKDVLDVSDAIYFDDFDHLFTYNGDDLGARYTKNKTTFRLWAPLSSACFLKCRKKEDDTPSYHLMKRDVNGTYFLTLEGDQDSLIYTYIVVNNGVIVESIDPYAFSSLANEKASVVVNMEKYVPNFHEDKLPPFNSYSEATIYEAHVRDLTISKMTDIEHKGKFLGLIEEKRKTLGGNPAGFDYLKSLGFSHLQFQPLQDYKTVDELDPNKLYNWGYDPRQYFALEGSFATDPNDAYKRVNEFKDVVAKFHSVGIRINVDVVYNHLYEGDSTSLDKIVPDYFYRHLDNGKLSNGSGCGNDFASERPMARKLIIDSILFLIKYYHIDGLRFDLMGLLDVETMNLLTSEAKKLKKDFMIYGEGWNMPTPILEEDRAHHGNAAKMKDIAFFNDAFRNIVGGGIGYDLRNKGYALGEESYREGFKFTYLGSCLEYCYDPRFIDANQSLNYVECHDNETFYDKLVASFSDEDDENHLLSRVKMTNAIIALAFGVPFFHMGQEIGQSKKGNGNTYNAGDKYNQLDYKLLDERQEMVRHFKDILTMRKSLKELHTYAPEEILKMVTFKDLEHGGLIIDYGSNISNFEAFKVIINPADETIYYELDDYHQVYLSSNGLVPKSDIHIKHLILPPRSTFVLVKYSN